MKLPKIIYLLLIAYLSFAAIPAGYYDDAAGLNGNDLRLALHNIIDGHTVKTYDQVWDAFATTDVRPVETYGTEYIWCMYTHLEFHYDEDQSSGTAVYTTYNREHSWPKSWANETYPHYTDLYHLYPVQAYANSIRNNLPYGEVEDGTATYTSENGSLRGDARAGLGYSGTVFEPIDEYKGDLARTYFYISTRYYPEDSDWNTSPMTNKCELLEWAVDMLLDWHHNDPVSQKELDRIEAIYTIQGNRNPFIDHPNYADSIWASTSTIIDAPLAQDASSIQQDKFTANWSEVSEATGYKLYVSESSDFSDHITNYGPKDVGNNFSETVTSLASSTTYYYRVKAYKTGEESGYSNVTTVETAAPSETVDSTKIFFSEYIEGSSYNKALEIYNGAGADIDLSKITIKLYSADNTSPYRTLNLSGNLLSKQVYVLAHPDANAAILAEADITDNSVVNFNGDDKLELYYNNALIDIIGEVGASGNFAINVTLVRKADILQGNTTYTTSEWNSYVQDETSYLGSHTVSETPTAISLQEFNAYYENGVVILNWNTASETENAAFQIFRNNDFLNIVEGSGTTSVTHYYEYIDNNVTPGQNYTYILNDLDYSGNITPHEKMSVTITIPAEEHFLLPEGSIGNVYPNPFNPIAILPINLNQNTDINITLYDIFGHKCQDIISGNYQKGDYNIPINAANLPSGAYVLHVRMGGTEQTQKIILSK
ncbi:MAG: hypothetical protein DRP93_03350 [Candidatus Neomarinimicrobiota bacterium]|nr:MAG: hypothetical protein DRP93_03350 [Candidatus Neomarinimicrobiota bacterium]